MLIWRFITGNGNSDPVRRDPTQGRQKLLPGSTSVAPGSPLPRYFQLFGHDRHCSDSSVWG